MLHDISSFAQHSCAPTTARIAACAAANAS